MTTTNGPVSGVCKYTQETDSGNARREIRTLKVARVSGTSRMGADPKIQALSLVLGYRVALMSGLPVGSWARPPKRERLGP